MTSSVANRLGTVGLVVVGGVAALHRRGVRRRGRMCRDAGRVSPARPGVAPRKPPSDTPREELVSMDASKPVKVVKDVVEAAAEKVADVLTPDVPGAPGSAPPSLDEPTTPHDPLPPKHEQGA